MEDKTARDEPSSPRPNFFIVGAPRCGTTSMTHWLSKHPQVFTPEIKVPFHFASDLDMVPKRAFRNPRVYLDLFSAASTHARVGESTPFYLYSQRAAEEIRQFDPHARIIVMLRNPVDMMYSMHARNLMDGNDTIKEFGAALQLEPRRMAGSCIPRTCFFREGLYYRALARFPEQLRRYFAVFDRAQVHVVIFDDLKADPRGCFNRVLAFLELSADIDIPLDRANPSVAVRSPTLAGLLQHPSRPIQRLPARMRDSVIWRLNRWNRLPANGRRMDPSLRQQLLIEFAPDITELGSMLQRDLSAWLD